LRRRRYPTESPRNHLADRKITLNQSAGRDISRKATIRRSANRFRGDPEAVADPLALKILEGDIQAAIMSWRMSSR
jgi:hypothetical protein